MCIYYMEQKKFLQKSDSLSHIKRSSKRRKIGKNVVPSDLLFKIATFRVVVLNALKKLKVMNYQSKVLEINDFDKKSMVRPTDPL